MSKQKEARAQATAAAKKATQLKDRVGVETRRLQDAKAALEGAREDLHGTDVDDARFDKVVSRRLEALARVDVLEARVEMAIQASAEASKAAEEADMAAEEAEIVELKTELASLNEFILGAVRETRAVVAQKLRLFADLVRQANDRERALIVRRGGKDEGWKWPDFHGALCGDLFHEAPDVLGRLESRILRNSY